MITFLEWLPLRETNNPTNKILSSSLSRYANKLIAFKLCPCQHLNITHLSCYQHILFYTFNKPAWVLTSFTRLFLLLSGILSSLVDTMLCLLLRAGFFIWDHNCALYRTGRFVHCHHHVTKLVKFGESACTHAHMQTHPHPQAICFYAGKHITVTENVWCGNTID